jgi:hypothetical protein|tara:strand:- start:236 stop:847 length:612 start_codon:yes stop_codon:yes gene_type:complete
MYARPQKTERLEVENGDARFESLMAKKLSDKDRKFAESLKRQFEDGGKLSVKQIECVDRMEQRYSPASVLKREHWAQSYKGDHRETALIVARYYRSTQYFRDLATKVLLEEDFIPTERQFTALTKNKYAKRVIATATEPPAYPVGTICKVRANHNLVPHPHLHDQIALVMNNHPIGLYASSTVLVNGVQVKLEDRCLKAAKSR